MIFARIQQVLHMAADVILAVLRSAAAVVKSIFNSFVPSQEKSICGEVVLITGAGRGISRELAIQFAGHGCTVVCVDVDHARNQDTVNEVNLKFQQRLEDKSLLDEEPRERIAFGYTCDINDRNATMNTAQQVLQDFGRIDILINNALTSVGPKTNANPVGTVEEINMNLMSNFWIVLAVLPGKVARKHGHIVAMSSMDDVTSFSTKVPYSTAHTTVAGLMDSLNEGLRLQERKIHTTCVNAYCIHAKPYMSEIFHLRIHELTPEFAASEIIRGVRQNQKTLTIPRNLLFWVNVFRTLPPDTRNIWQDVFYNQVHVEHSDRRPRNILNQ